METVRTLFSIIAEWSLIGLGLLALASLGSRLLLRWLNPERGAEQIHHDAKAAYSGPHEFAEVEARAFRWADLRYYAESEAALETLGFRKLGDLEDVTLSRIYPSMRTFIRTMANADGTISAGIFHVKIRGWMRLLVLCRLIPGNLRSVDLETELSDGSFVGTGNSQGKDLSSEVPGISRLALPDATPLSALVTAHGEHLARVLAERPGLSARRVQSLADDIAMQQRMQELKNRQQAAKGFVDLEQFDRCVPATDDPEQAAVSAQMRQHLAQLAREERATAER